MESNMRTYVIATGIVFTLLVLAHIGRVVAEGIHLVREPDFALATLVASGFSFWAWRLVRQTRQP